MSHLVPCPDCGRHVRVHEAECPFCAASLNLAATPPPVLPKRRLGRAALFAFGATLVGITAIGCGDSDDGGGTGGSSGSAGSSGSGGSAGSAGSAGSGGSAGTAGTGGSAGAAGSAGFAGAGALYGVPPDDAGSQPLYGAAPP
jgi:hypothetical protein